MACWQVAIGTTRETTRKRFVAVNGSWNHGDCLSWRHLGIGDIVWPRSLMGRIVDALASREVAQRMPERKVKKRNDRDQSDRGGWAHDDDD